MDGSTDLNEDFLEHYGVKGMRWGTRRSEAQLAKDRGRKTADAAVRNKRKQAAKNRRLMSDKDIEKALDRLQKEKRLKDLTDQDVSPGKTAVKMIMSESGKKVARTVVAGTALYAVKVVIDKKLGPSASNYIAPRPKNK